MFKTDCYTLGMFYFEHSIAMCAIVTTGKGLGKRLAKHKLRAKSTCGLRHPSALMILLRGSCLWKLGESILDQYYQHQRGEAGRTPEM